MGTLHFCILSVFLVCLASVFCTKPVEENERLSPLQAISQSNLNFTSSMYKELAKNEGNFIFSPISMQVVLAMLYMGARGNTAQQIAQGLHLSTEKETTKDGFLHLIRSLTTNGPLTLDIANKIYADKSIGLNRAFLDTTQQFFLSVPQNVDFQTHTEAARRTINQWVETMTHSKIQDLLPRGVLSRGTVMVLVNAIYFKGNWSTPFNPKSTSIEPFFINLRETKDVQMMKLSYNLPYFYDENLEAGVLKLSYAESNLGLVIILPSYKDGLSAVEAKLPEVSFIEIMKKLDRPVDEVHIKIPKFKLEHFIDLNAPLKKLGMVDMFEDTADFSGLKESGPTVKVNNVVQKAFIEVNEQGSEASAGTGLVGGILSLPPQFTADHPFAFFLVDSETKTVLFAGRYAVPN